MLSLDFCLKCGKDIEQTVNGDGSPEERGELSSRNARKSIHPEKTRGQFIPIAWISARPYEA